MPCKIRILEWVWRITNSRSIHWSTIHTLNPLSMIDAREYWFSPTSVDTLSQTNSNTTQHMWDIFHISSILPSWPTKRILSTIVHSDKYWCLAKHVGSLDCLLWNCTIPPLPFIRTLYKEASCQIYSRWWGQFSYNILTHHHRRMRQTLSTRRWISSFCFCFSFYFYFFLTLCPLHCPPSQSPPHSCSCKLISTSHLSKLWNTVFFHPWIHCRTEI